MATDKKLWETTDGGLIPGHLDVTQVKQAMDIFRFKRRMVFPEVLTLDELPRKPSANSNVSSWCDEPIDDGQNVPNSTNHRNFLPTSGYRSDTDRNYSSSAQSEKSNGSSANRQFIQDRIRHLVEAFTYRTQATKQRIEMPATPSSISSHETLEPNAATKLVINPEENDEKLPEVAMIVLKPPKRQFFSHIKNIFERKVIDPQGRTYVFWMSIAALAVLYNAWVIPLRSTFPYQDENNRGIWMFFDYLADFIYLVDLLFVQPRIMFLSEGFWMKDISFTKQNYFAKTNFKLDVISLLPLDLLYIWLGPEHVILRFPRFFKMHTFWDFFSHVDKRISNPHTVRISRTLLYMMYLIHLNACAYYAFSAWEGIGTNTFVFNGRGIAYVRCFYFATKTATSIGKNPKPTHEIEFLFMTFSWLMGVFVFALLIGQIRDIFATAARSQTEYRKLVDETLEYMRRLNLPGELQKRVQLWFNYTWETQHTLDEKSITDCLPNNMKTDIAINIHIKTLSKVNLFADCDEALLRELVLQLKSVIYLPGDIICKKGDVGKEMYIVQSGKVQVMGPGDNVLATLCEGSVFGEISLLEISGMNRRTADVRSQGFSNLFVLSKADLNAALFHYPEAQELLNKKAKMLMKKNAQIERKHNALIVINNPTPRSPQARLIDTVMQVVPPDSKTNHLLRYGSRGRPRKSKVEVDHRSSLPSVRDMDVMADYNEAVVQTTKATVHREQ